MAGHSTLHPYLKTYDECKRSANRMVNFLKIYGNGLAQRERENIETIIEHLTVTANLIPEEYQVSRYKQFKDDDK